jgi:hypothetical protein
MEKLTNPVVEVEEVNAPPATPGPKLIVPLAVIATAPAADAPLFSTVIGERSAEEMA